MNLKKLKQGLTGGILGLLSVFIKGETVLASDFVSETISSFGISVPNSEVVTRGQFAEILLSLSGNNIFSTAQSPFSDVPSTRRDAQSITTVYNLGLLNGCGDGTFAPDRGITLGEVVTSVLRLLEYSTDEIGYRWPEDYVAKGEILGLLDNVENNPTATLSQKQVETLCYNILTGTDKNSNLFAYSLTESWIEDVLLLSNSATVGGVEQLLSVLQGNDITYYNQSKVVSSSYIGMGRGTLLLDEKGEAFGFLPFPSEANHEEFELTSVDAMGVKDDSNNFHPIPSTATLVMGETITNFGSQYFALESYNSLVIYYGNTGAIDLVIAKNNVWMDGYVISGFYEAATPNPYQPTTVTVVGCEFQISPEISSKFAQFAYGDRFHLVLDEEGRVCDVIPYASELQEDMVGILQADGSVILVNGITLYGDSKNRCYAEVGQLVKVLPSGIGTVTISPAKKSTHDSVDLSKMKLGAYPLSSQIKIYECVDNGVATARSLDSMTITSIPSTEIRYYQLNSQGEVIVLLLNNATGDNYSYGIVKTCIITEQSSLGEIRNNGFHFNTVEGLNSSIKTQAMVNYDGAVCGVLFDENGGYSSHIPLESTLSLGRSAFLGTETLVSNGIRIPIASDVSVYDSQYERWISLETALVEYENFVGYYDKTPEDGGKIRVIFPY